MNDSGEQTCKQFLDKMKSRERLTVNATPITECPACCAKRIHTEQEKLKYHPAKDRGVMDGKRINYED